jgi:hypothetical protein
MPWDRFAASCVTLGILFDWVPAYIGLNPAYLSLLKIVVLPVLAVDFVRRPSDYLAARASGFGRLFLISYLVGVGGGVLLGTVSVDRFIALAPVSGVLMFYLKQRPPEETGRILRLALWAATAVSVVSILGAFGVLTPSYEQNLSTGSRYLTGVSYSTLGLFGAFIPAALGGIVFQRPDLRLQRRTVVLGSMLTVLGLVGMLVTGQRSAPAGFVLAFGLSFALYLLRSSIRNFGVAVALAAILTILGWQFQTPLAEIAATTMGRTESIWIDPEAGGVGLRRTFYAQFADDLATHPALIAPGSTQFILTTGDIPHFIVGEAYYDGGLVFMVVVLAAFLMSGWRTWWNCWFAPRGRAQYGMQLALWASVTSVLSLHPGLETRISYMLLGLWLAPAPERRPGTPARLARPPRGLNP